MKYFSWEKFFFIKKVLTTAVVFLLLLLLFIFTLPYLFQLSPYVVLTDSMGETMEKGSVVFIKKAEFDEIKVSDIALFRSKKNPEKSFTHRVIEINSQKKSFVTKGDAVLTADPLPAPAESLVGKVVLTLPFAGLPALWLKNKLVLILTVLFLIVWIAAELEAVINKRKIRKSAI